MAKPLLKDKMTSKEFKEFWDKQEKAKGSKYGAIPTETADGNRFDSKLEATYYNRMKLLLAAGELVKLERSVRYELIVNGVFITSYKADFVITWKDGREEVIDCKSQPTQTRDYKLRKKLMLAIHNIEIKEVFE